MGKYLSKLEEKRKISGLLAGFCGLWAVSSDLKSGILHKISEAGCPVKAADLAKRGRYSLPSVEAWLKAAYSFEILDYVPGEGFLLSPHTRDILLDKSDADYLGSTIMMFSGLSGAYQGLSKRIKGGKKSPPEKQGIALKKAMAEVTRRDFTVIIDGIINADKELRKLLGGQAEVLDIGTGLGYSALCFSKAFPKIKVTALDIDKSSIAEARRNIGRQGCVKNIRLLTADARKADFDRRFDLIFMNLSLHEIGEGGRERAAFLNKCRGWLKNKGLLLISELPFPVKMRELRKLSSKIILGVEMFEEVFGDKLMSVPETLKLLKKSGFGKIQVIKGLIPLRAIFLARK